MNRYARQTCLPEIGDAGQAKLATARLLVVGAGGLGCAALPLLAGAGVGTLRIIDPDCVEASNLHRQTLYRMTDIGHPKAVVAAHSLIALNPDCRAKALVTRLDAANAPDEVAMADLVIDAADNFAVTYLLSDLCQAAGKPLISASVLGRAGYTGGFCGGAPSYRALFPDPPPVLQDCNSGGVMGPVVALLGAAQAQMALSVLLGHQPSPLGLLLRTDLAGWRLASFRFDDAPEPATPGPRIVAPSQITPDDLVIDLRCDGPPAQPAAGQRVVFTCISGLRAWRAAVTLAESGHQDVAICAIGT